MPRQSVRRPYLALAALAVILLAAACARADGDFLVGPEGSPASTATPAAESRPSERADAAAGAAGAVTWQIGDAAEMELSVRAGALQLISLRPAPGWSVTSQQADAEEIELKLERGDDRWELEVELDDGRLEVESTHERKRADPGSFLVGIPGLAEAATVTIEREGNALRLSGISVNDGWEHAVQEASRSTVKIEFLRDGATWKFEAKRAGRSIELKLELKLNGPATDLG